MKTPLRKGQPAATVQWRRQGAWPVLLGLAALVTLYLAWGAWASARHPSRFFLDNSWWHALLQPGQDIVPVVFLALWLAVALTYWWPRRRRLQDVGLVVVATMVAVGAVLGAASLAPCRGSESRSAVVAWVLSLYVGALEPRYGPGTVCPGQLPLALQVGRTVCLGATFAGAIAAAAVLWRQPVGRLRARLVKDATIVTGLDAMTIPLLYRLTSAGPASRVVVIEPDRNHPLLEEARSTGAQIMVADPRSEQVLRPLVRGVRGPQLRYLYALRPEVSDNEAILAAAGQVLRQYRSNADRPPHLIARVDDPRHADVWRGRRVGRWPLWFEDALSPQESTARTLVAQVARTGVRQVLLCADSTLALSILLELGRQVWEQQGLSSAEAQGGRAGDAAVGRGPAGVAAGNRPVPGKIVLMDRRAKDLLREYEVTAPPAVMRVRPDVQTRAEDWRDHLLAWLDRLPDDQDAQTAVVIADTPSEGGLHEAGRVASLHRDTPVFILAAEGTDVTEPIFDRLRPFHRTLLVGGQVPEDSWTRISRLWHETYRRAHPAAAGSGKELTRRPWKDLDEFIREDNILQLRSVMAEVARLGRHWIPAREVVPGSIVDLTGSEVHRVASAEHTRWYQHRDRAGWHATAAGEQDDDSLLRNSNVRPWAELPAQAREQACQQVRSQLEQLAAAGFVPAVPEDGPPGAASYTRIGEVRARKLKAGKTWQNGAGDTFTADPGDWLVVDELGHERTIRDSEFRASHTALGDDRWQRTGTVLAWRVDEPTGVHTLEGRAVAQAGDWIVQGCAGERWPVADDQFARGYIPTPG